MAPPSHTDPRSYALTLLAEPLAVCRLAANAPVPPWAHAPPFSSITRTPHELSIVCAASAVPADVPPEVATSRGWRALRVDGPLDLALVGVLASLVLPLAAARVNVFTIATHDTDWILVPDARLTDARGALIAAGHAVRDAASATFPPS